MFGCLRLIRRVIVLLTLVALALTVAAAAVVLTYAHRHDIRRTDAIVVLGAAQYAGKPTPLLRNRLDHARVLYRDGISGRIITVGGKRPGDITTEGESGRRYLRSKGIPADAAVAVPQGRNTWTSVQAVASLAARKGWQSVTIVSDPTHVGRAAAMARRLGLTASVSGTIGGPGSHITAAQTARETAGLLWFWAQRWLPAAVRDRWQG